jgi:hypothetical protein
MQGAAESDIKVIQSAMKAKKSASSLNPKRAPHSRIEPVAKLATRLATGIEASEVQMPDFPANLKWRRGWDSKGRALEIRKIQEE